MEPFSTLHKTYVHRLGSLSIWIDGIDSFGRSRFHRTICAAHFHTCLSGVNGTVFTVYSRLMLSFETSFFSFPKTSCSHAFFQNITPLRFHSSFIQESSTSTFIHDGLSSSLLVLLGATCQLCHYSSWVFGKVLDSANRQAQVHDKCNELSLHMRYSSELGLCKALGSVNTGVDTNRFFNSWKLSSQVFIH